MSEHHAVDGIVVGVDGSAASTAAVEWAAQEAALRQLPVTLVHVQPDAATAAAWIAAPIAAAVLAADAQEGRDILAQAAARVTANSPAGKPISVHQRLLSGAAVPVLSDMSKDADMVVVGCRGLSTVPRVLVGSVSRGLLHHAHCPVAVIRHERGASISPEAPVVVGVDGSEASQTAVAIALDEASRRGVGLTVVHACSDDNLDIVDVGWQDVFQLGAEIVAEQLAGHRERYPDVTVRTVVKLSAPARWIIDEGEHSRLIVVGSHGRGGFAGMLLGSVSNSVVQAAHVPVIVARGLCTP